MRLVLIPPGEFIMGSPADEEGRLGDELPHLVRISRPFYLGVFEVTQAEYEAVLGYNPAQFRGPRHPVEQVNWEEAVEFCGRLSRKASLKYRLPNEAESESASRPGTTTRTYLGAVLP